MKAALPSEHASQAAVIEWWAIACGIYRLPECALFAIPNAAKRSFALAAYMRAEGMRAGIPDLMLAVPRGYRHGLFIELKRRPNKASPEQVDVMKYLNAGGGYRAVICWSTDEAIAAIKEYLC